MKSIGISVRSPNVARRKCSVLAVAFTLLSSMFTGCAAVVKGPGGQPGGVPPLPSSSVQVESSTAQHFYFMRRDIWDSIGLEDPSKRNSQAVSSYGPFDIGTKVTIDEGMQYIFLPECSGKIEWNKAVRPVIPVGAPFTSIKIAC
jgi:hypothetical protein